MTYRIKIVPLHLLSFSSLYLATSYPCILFILPIPVKTKENHKNNPRSPHPKFSILTYLNSPKKLQKIFLRYWDKNPTPPPPPDLNYIPFKTNNIQQNR
jgi:hypothetical protein